MATITSAASGLASAGSTWTGGIVPVEGDKVIIAAGHVVTLDGTFTWGDDSVTQTIPNAAINVSGTLKASRSVSSSLTCKGLLLCNYATHALDFGTVADPIPNGVTATLLLNKATTPAVREGIRQVPHASGAGNFIKWTFVGWNGRARGVKLAADATTGSAVIELESAAHNWQVGDSILLFTTTNNTNTNECEIRTVSSVAGEFITLNVAPTYLHKAGSPACNLTSNVKLRSFNEVGSQMATGNMYGAPSGTAPTAGIEYRFNDVEFGVIGGSANTGLAYNGNETVLGVLTFSLDRCTLRNTVSSAGTVMFANPVYPRPLTDFVAYSTGGVAVYGPSRLEPNGCWFATGSTPMFSNQSWSGVYRNCWITSLGPNTSIAATVSVGVSLENCVISGYASGIVGGASRGTVLKNCDVGFTYGYKDQFGDSGLARLIGSNFLIGQALIEDCLLNSALERIADDAHVASQSDLLEYTFLNKNRDVIQQEVWKAAGKVSRDNALKSRGVSSIALKHFKTGADLTRTQSIPCANGSTIRVVGYVRMDTAFWNAGDNNLPTVSLSGLGAATVTHTASAAANNAWEKFDISITNSSGNDGNFVLTYTANAKTVSTGTVYFDGVPDSPFITKVRHYGFLFNETSPTREVNPYTVAIESVAAAYTGTTINATTKRVTFGIGTADTLNKVYDYSQAWAVLNIDKEVPWQRAGALLSLTSGWTVVDPVITGVTWGGGTIEWNTPGSITGSFDSTTFRFNAAGTYDLSGGTFAGTINLTNTSGGGVIVIVLPSGIDYVNDDPGSITVEVAVESATASITNIVPGTRLQVYNVTTATEMVNTIVAGTSWSDSYPNGTGYSTGDVVRVRLAWMDGVEAKLPVQYQTVAASGGWSILADQVDDTVYNYNAIDGDTCTEFSHDFANVQVDVDDADNTTTVQRGYAWFIAGQMTADGIRYFFGGITAEDSVNYRINAALVNLRIQNIKAGSNLTVTGGNIYRTDDTDIFAPGASGSTASMRYGRAYTVRVGGGTGLSPEESAKLMSLPSASTVAAAVDASTVLAKEETAAAALVQARNAANAALSGA